jgi:hypothetical protein
VSRAPVIMENVKTKSTALRATANQAGRVPSATSILTSVNRAHVYMEAVAMASTTTPVNVNRVTRAQTVK